jgi:hypothetical protein
MKKQVYILIFLLTMIAGKAAGQACVSSLTSGASTDNQTVCISNAITTITYSTDATGAVFAGLPAGVSGSFSAPTVTISGTPSVAGTFNYTVTLSGCTGTLSGTIVVKDTPTATAGGSQTICQTGTATVSGATSSNGTILWTHNGAGSLSGATTLTPVYTPDAGDAGTAVTLTMTVSNSPCSAATATYTVNVKATPTATAGGSQTICQNGTATVSGATSSNGTILWSHNGAGSISGGTTLTPVYTAAAGDAGNTVTLTMTVSNSPCSNATATYSVSVKATPTATAGGSQTICETGTATVSGATSSNGTILWSHNGAGSISGGTTLTPVYTAAAGDGGNTVTLTMTVSNSPCAAATATYSVIVEGTPTATAGGSQSICQNGTATVSGATSSNGNILWSHNGTGSISGATTLTPVYTAAAGDAGNAVTLTMTVSNSTCVSATATYTVNVKAIPTATAGGSQTICQTGTATVSGATSSNGTILWSHNGAGSISGATTLTPVYTPIAADAGNTVTLTMTVSNSPCSAATATYTVAVSPTSVGGTVASAQTICNGVSPVAISVTGNTGSVLRWEWDTNNGFSSPTTINVPSATLGSVDMGSLTTDTYFRAIVKSGACAITNSTGVKITVHGAFSSSISGGATSVCYNTSPGTFTASATGGHTPYSYQWYNTSGIISGATLATYNPGSITATTGYYCAVTSNSSCGTDITATSTVTVRPQITLSGAIQADQICSGSAATINLSGLLGSTTSIIDYSVNGVNQPSVPGVASSAGGTASFLTTGLAAVNNGKILSVTQVTTGSAPACSASFTQNTSLIVNSATTPILSGNDKPCINSTGNVYTTDGGMSAYTWTVSAGGTITAGGTGTSNSVTVTWNTAGNQSVSVNYTNINLCTAASPTILPVTVSALPTPTITGPASACLNSTGNVYITEPGMLSYTWTVSAGGTVTSGGTGNMIVVKWLNTGAQTVSVNSSNTSLCSASSPNYNVIVNALPVPAVAGPATPRITSTGNVYSTTGSMTNYIWTLSGGGTKTAGGTATDNSMTVTWNNSGAQTVSVYYTDGNTCTAASPTSYPVSVKDLPVATGVSISGTAAIGSLLTGTYTYNDFFAQGTSTFRWMRNGIVIPGATLVTYTPVSADLNKVLTFEVTPVSLTGPPTGGLPVISTATAAVEDLSGYPVADQVCIEGIRAGGSVLKGKYRYTYIKAEGVSTFRWLRNGSPIPGATLTEYTLSQFDDIDSKADITFEVTPVSSNIIPRAGTPVVSRPIARMTLPQDEYSVAVSEVVLTSNESGGVFSGPGVTNGKFSPSAVGITGSPYTVNYLLTIVNSATTCSQQASESIRVVSNTTSFSGVNPVYCTNGATDIITVTGYPITASPYGFYSTNASAIVSQNMWSVTIDPTKLQPGVNNDILYFYYINLGYFYMISQPLVVESQGTDFKFINLNPAYCATDAVQPISIVGTYPAGGTGTFTGLLLSNKTNTTADLDPKAGTAGTSYNITYRFQSAGGCLSDILPATVTINPLPNANFALDLFYNVDGPDVPVVPVQPGGSFSGKGISQGRLFPSIGGLGERTITYTITDINSCTNFKENKTTILKAEGTFTGIPAVICYADINYNIKVTNLPKGRTVTSFTNTKNSIVHNAGDTTAVYSVKAAGAGIDVLTLTYKLDNVDYSISMEVNIDQLEQVEIRNLFPGDVICNNKAPFELITSYKNGEFLSGPVTGGFLDPTKALGDTEITYKYTNQKTGCFTTVTVPFSIIPAPVLSFTLADNCIKNSNDSTRLINTTPNANLINNWVWEFSDGGLRYSTKRDPSNLYKVGGSHSVTMTANTTNCSVSKLFSFAIGVKPAAKFDWKKECYSAADSLILIDLSTSDSKIASRSWNFLDGSPLKTDSIVKLQKKTTGYVSVELTVNTQYTGCSSTISKSIYIRPNVSLATDNYFQNFEGGAGGWIKSDDATGWSFAKPDRTVINTAASGNNAWFTPVALTSQKLKASVISPCFDFTLTERPMISLATFKRFNRDGDGAVIQYQIGDDKTWTPLGTIDDGINWYNSNLIKGLPGDASLGWSSRGTPDTKWTESRHTLDELVGKKDVKFRIAYGSDGYGAETEGIAFDDIFIGERSRNVLIEHFANTSSADSKRATALVNQIVKDKNLDVINIQYHTNFPGSDPFYEKNPGDAGARTLSYGLIRSPYTFIDGGSDKLNFANRYDYNVADIDSSDVILRSLINPKFRISLTTAVTSGVLTVNGNMSALENISSDNLTLYIAVTEKENSKITGANGETKFYNTFRKFLPDAGGISLKKVWTSGETAPITNYTWIVDKILNASDIYVIAFIQNSVTKETYQSVSKIENALSVGMKDEILKSESGFTLFPNPATERLSVRFGETLKTDAEIRIYDFRGTVVRTFRVQSGDSEFVTDGLGLSDGIYMLRVTTGGIDQGFKKLIISNH